MASVENELAALLAAARESDLVVVPSGSLGGQTSLRVEGLDIHVLGTRQLRRVLGDVDEGVDRVWHWRRDLPGLDRLALPGGVVERRVICSEFPIHEVLLDDDTLAQLDEFVPSGTPPDGAPRWLAGMAHEARAKAKRIQQLLTERARGAP